MMRGDSVIRSVVYETVLQMVGPPLEATTPLLSSGRIDSLSILNLIFQLENMLGMSLPAEALQMEDFESIESMLEIIEKVAVAK